NRNSTSPLKSGIRARESGRVATSCGGVVSGGPPGGGSIRAHERTETTETTEKTEKTEKTETYWLVLSVLSVLSVFPARFTRTPAESASAPAPRAARSTPRAS